MCNMTLIFDESSLTVSCSNIVEWENVEYLASDLKQMFGTGYYNDSLVSRTISHNMHYYIEKDIKNYSWSFSYHRYWNQIPSNPIRFHFKSLNDFVLAKLTLDSRY